MPKDGFLKIINKEDFPEEAALVSLGLKESPLRHSFGITDPVEIQDRQDLIRIMIENPRLAGWINETDVPFELPDTESDFLAFTNPSKPHNPYWRRVRKLIEICEDIGIKNLPRKLKTLVTALKDSLPLEDSEQCFLGDIAEQLLKIASFEGLATFKVNIAEISQAERKPETFQLWSEDGFEAKEITPNYRLHDLAYDDKRSHIWGHRAYSYDVNEIERESDPDWGIFNFIWDMYAYILRWRAYRPMAISGISSGLICDLIGAVEQILRKIPQETNWLFGSTIQVYFRYDSSGMKIRFYNLLFDEPKELPASDWYLTYHDSYPLMMRREISRLNKKYQQAINSAVGQRRAAYARAQVMRINPRIFEDIVRVDSPNSDSIHKYFALENLYGEPSNRPYVKAVEAHRKFFKEHFKLLKEVAEVAISLRNVATKYDLPICYPQFRRNGHIVQFGEIYPIQLITNLKKEEQIVGIKGVVPLNGQIIGLTGKHGGGKSVDEVTIAVKIWLAQSGLCVFGEGYDQNPKKVIACVFLKDKPTGSTCESAIEKLTTVLNEIDAYEPREVVVIVDELGANTQEDDGEELGFDFLKGLKDRGVSVMFSTQIQSLAHRSEDELGAACFKVESDHSIVRGIGKGGLSELRVRSGFNEALVFNGKKK